MNKKSSSLTTRTAPRQMRVRAQIAVWLVVGILFTANILRLGWLQIFEAEDWQRRAVSQQLSDTVVSAKRGPIYASNMQPLAESADVWKIIMSPKNIAGCNWKNLEGVDKDKELSKEEGLELMRRRIAKDLAEMFQLDEDELYEQTGKTYSQYEVIKSKVEYKDKNEFSDWVNKNGLSYAFYIITDYKRYYPQGSMAANVLGFTGSDNNGLYGLEIKYESVLSGTPGRIVTAQNGIGNEMPTTMEYTKVVDAVNGYGLVTTIDPTVQMYTEKYLGEAVTNTGTLHRGVAIVMDVNTGAVLAMATKGDFNPNDPFTVTDPTTLEMLEELSGDDKATALSSARQLQWNNKAITETYEPGSVFKVFTTAMALEEGLATENTSFACRGSINVAGWNISCHTRSHMGILNLRQAVSNSCNPYFVQLGLKIGASTYYKYFNGFGFTEKTGIDMQGEMSNEGLYHSASTLMQTESSLATASFGQTFKVTPIQMITAVAAAANGGYLVTPHVVKEITSTDDNGKTTVVKTTEANVKRQVISEATSDKLCSLLESVVSVGSGKNAYVKGYRVAGKTGTSEKLASESSTGEDEYIASFIGFAPADDPQIAILVMLDEPNGAEYFGGLTAAPVAGNILSEVLPYLEINAEYTEDELESLDTSVPAVSGTTTDEAIAKIKASGLSYKIIGGEGTVDYQMPKSGTSIPRTGTVVLYTNGKEPSATVTVPDITKMSVAGASKMINNYGLNFRSVGNESTKNTALITSQEPAAGTLVEAGTVITAHYKNYDDVSN